MTPEERYLFDIQGFLHLEQALTPTELSEARQAYERLLRTADDDLPPGLTKQGRSYTNGFSFVPAFERLALHSSIWPLVKEMTAEKPRMASGTLRVNTHEDVFGALHSAREGWPEPDLPRYFSREGRIHCDFIVAFFYLTDVHPGDGGLVVIPGSHKSDFERPVDFFTPSSGTADPAEHPAVTNVIARAGDVVVMTELTTHGVLTWKPRDRSRNFLMLRYVPQYVGSTDENLPFPIPPEVTSRLLPEVQELVAFTPRHTVKSIVASDRPLG